MQEHSTNYQTPTTQKGTSASSNWKSRVTLVQPAPRYVLVASNPLEKRAS